MMLACEGNCKELVRAGLKLQSLKWNPALPPSALQLHLKTTEQEINQNEFCGKSLLGSCVRPCALKLSALLFAAHFAEEFGEIWPFFDGCPFGFSLSSWSFFCILLLLTVPHPQCCLYQTITTSNPTCSPAQPETGANLRWARGEALEWDKSWTLKLRSSLGSAESQGQVVTGAPGAAGLRGALSAHRSSILIQNIYQLVFMRPCLFQQHTHRYFPLMFL